MPPTAAPLASPRSPRAGRRRWSTDADRDRGSAALEALIVAVALIALLVLVIAGGRLAAARGRVADAARDAARAASLQRSPAAAQGAAGQAAQETLTGARVACARSEISVDAAGLDAALGTASAVRATVRCQVALADLAVPGLPGTQTMTAEAVAPVDSYRGRAP